MEMKEIVFRPKGQALVIVLLIMAVVLTVGLSVVSQAISDIRLSQKEEDASRAFSAAETGLEKALIQIPSDLAPTGAINNANFAVSKAELGAGQHQFLFPGRYVSGETAPLWLVTRDANGDPTCSASRCYSASAIEVCWGSSDDASSASGQITAPALEVALLYRDTGGNYRIWRNLLDPYTGGDPDRTTNGFTDTTSACSANIEGESLRYGQTIDFSSIPSYSTVGTLVTLRMKMHYNTNSQRIGVITSSGTPGELPSQGSDVVSVGTYGDSTQRVRATKLFLDAPSAFDYTLYAGNNAIIK